MSDTAQVFDSKAVVGRCAAAKSDGTLCSGEIGDSGSCIRMDCPKNNLYSYYICRVMGCADPLTKKSICVINTRIVGITCGDGHTENVDIMQLRR